MGMIEEVQPTAAEAGAVDVILHKNDKWHGYFTGYAAVVAALASAVKARMGGDDPLKGRMVLVVGLNEAARGVAVELLRRGVSVILASHKKKAGLELAQELGCRQVQFEALYSTMHDALVVCDEEKEEVRAKPGAAGVHPGYLKPQMTVVDLTSGMKRSQLLRDAETRGCAVVTPRDLLLEQLGLQARLFTGKQVEHEVLAAALPASLTEEEEGRE
jgi:shikimate 5-dehydrogenase